MYYKASLACYFPIFFVGPQPILRAIPAHIFPQGEMQRLKRSILGGVHQRRVHSEPLLLSNMGGNLSFLEGLGALVRTRRENSVLKEIEPRTLICLLLSYLF